MTAEQAEPNRPEDAVVDGVVDVAVDDHKLAAARLWATTRYPYLASAVFAAKTVPGPGLERLMIDRWWRIHVDPTVVAAATVDQLGGELLHLMSHVLRDHAARSDELHFTESAELHHWVDAADAEIADDFPSDLARVSNPVTPSDLACETGRLAEEYYRRGEVREHETNDCGSGSHGEVAAREPPPPAEGDDNGVSAEQQQLIRRGVAAEISRAGSEVPDGLRRWAADELASVVDWRSELAALIRRGISITSGAVDYSYRRPARRASAVTGVVLPSLQRPTVEVAVVCDTSASVSDELLGQAVTEVDGLLRAVGARTVSVYSVDDAVRTVTRASNGRDVSLIGGGGTDMSVGIDAAMHARPEPQVLVVLTDGHTPWPVDRPRAEVIAGILEDHDDGLMPLPPEPPAWIRAVTISSP